VAIAVIYMKIACDLTFRRLLIFGPAGKNSPYPFDAAVLIE
jgi:hypothetical protein